MTILATSIRWIIVGLIFLGIGYNFVLPFTPVWLDVVAWSAIAAAFLIAAILGRRNKEQGERENSSADT